jgi:hypothetical protein
VSRGSSTQDPNRSSECRGFTPANWSSKMRGVRTHQRGRTGRDHNIGLSNDDSDQKPGTRDFYLLSRTAIKIHFNTTV